MSALGAPAEAGPMPPVDRHWQNARQRGPSPGLVGPLTQGDQGPLQPFTCTWTDVSPWGLAGGPALGWLAGTPPT